MDLFVKTIGIHIFQDILIEKFYLLSIFDILLSENNAFLTR